MSLSIERDDMLIRLLSASALRAEVLANNISNQDTPGYRREIVRFEELLQDRLHNGRDVEGVTPSIEKDMYTPVRADGNNVNPELERNAMRENRILYETYASILQGRFELLRSAIQDGR
jgi:flagellar basal-body rod protein FlgB